MKVQGRLVQACFIEIHQVSAKKKNKFGFFLTEQYYQLSQTIFCEDEFIQIHKKIIEPSLIYGGESLPARGKELSQINAVEIKCYQRIVGKTCQDSEEWKNQDNYLRRKIKLKLFKYFGNVVQMGEDRKSRHVMKAWP